MNKKIYLASPHMMGNERQYVKEAFDTNWIAPLGPFVNKLEEEFKKYFNLNGACALSSGTSALHLAIKQAGVKQGDIVFCSSLTFSASANPITYEGGIPVFIDSEPETYNMSPEALEKAFEKYPNPKAVIIVSLYGMPAKYDEIIEICKKHNTVIIEDAASDKLLKASAIIATDLAKSPTDNFIAKRGRTCVALFTFLVGCAIIQGK